jgi:hypothetical protein
LVCSGLLIFFSEKRTGLPDGIFSNQKKTPWLNLEGIAMEDVATFTAIWSTYFTAIWYSLWPFGIFYEYLVPFSRFGMLHQEKSGNPGKGQRTKGNMMTQHISLGSEIFSCLS